MKTRPRLELRTSSRASVALAAISRGIDSDGRGFRFKATVENISIGGLYMQLRVRVRPTAPITVSVPLPSGARLVLRSVVLRVIDRDDGLIGVAIRFESYRLL